MPSNQVTPYPAGSAEALLAQMQDIALPPPVSQTPALGWWLAAGLLLMVLAVLAILLHRYWRAQAYRRQAMAELKNLETLLIEGSATQAPDQAWAIQLNQLLRRTALHNQTDSAGLSEQAWVQYLLDSAAPSRAHFGEAELQALQAACYSNAPLSTEQAKTLISQSRYWLRRHKPVEQVINTAGGTQHV